MSYMKNFEKIKHGQIQFYINKIKKGDNEARNKIIYHYANQVLNIIEKDFNDEKYSKEDLFQAGLIGILEAIKSYQKSQNDNLRNIMPYYIYKEINLCINNERYNEIATTTDENQNFIDEFSDNENLILIKQIINKLPIIKQQIIYLYFYKDYKVSEIAHEFKINISKVYYILNTSINFIKEELDKINIDINEITNNSKKSEKKLLSISQLQKYKILNKI